MVLGAMLVIIGIIFLVGQFINIDFGAYLWPFFVIGFGALFFVGMVAGGPSTSGLAIPGSIIVTIGIMLLVQNTFDVWESWAYSWTLIIASVGIGIIIQGLYTKRDDLRRSGWRLVRLGLLLFLIFGAFFELIAFRQETFLSRIFWPLALIVVGAYLMITRLIRSSHPTSATPIEQTSVPQQDETIPPAQNP
jgi:hypothetical protein